MGQLYIMLDETGLDETGLDEMAINHFMYLDKTLAVNCHN